MEDDAGSPFATIPRDVRSTVDETKLMTRKRPIMNDVQMTTTGIVKNDITILDNLKAKWLGRQNEIEHLFEFLTTAEVNGTPSSLLVVGPAVAGKTSIVKDVVHHLGLDLAYVTAAQCNGSSREMASVLASQIQPKLQDLRLSSTARASMKKRVKTVSKLCRTPEELVAHIHDTLPVYSRKPLVIVVDDADEYDMIESISGAVWSGLKTLAERTKRNVKVIFIAQASDPKLSGYHDLFFPPYSEDVLRRILSQHLMVQLSRILFEETDSKDIEHKFKYFIKYVLARFAGVVTDLDDVSFIVTYLWRTALSDLETSSVTPAAIHKNIPMNAAIEHLSQRLYHRDCEALSKLMTKLAAFDGSGSIQKQNSLTASEINKRLNAIGDRELVGGAELPFFAKAMLIAFYMASYNPVDYDCVLFGARKRRKKRKLNANKLNQGESQSARFASGEDVSFVGPKIFSLERGRWLFRALLTDLSGSSEAEKASFGVHRYLDSLASLRLIAKSSDDAELGDVKFKCIASRFFCDAVARNLGLDLTKYLADGAVH